MPDAENTRKDRLEKTKDELVDELQDMERGSGFAPSDQMFSGHFL